MTIKPIRHQKPPAPTPTTPQAPLPQRLRKHPAGETQTPDQWASTHSYDSLDAPFWLIQMHRDQTLRRQWLNREEQAHAQQLESRWITQWFTELTKVPSPEVFPRTREEWQAQVNLWRTRAGVPLQSVRVVFQPAIAPLRAQFLFRVEQHLIQLNPSASGPPAAWFSSVSHELFHHAQQCLINALYQGVELEEPWGELARYYRDARIVYTPWHTSRDHHNHHQQNLEKGAVQFGTLLGQHHAASP